MSSRSTLVDTSDSNSTLEADYAFESVTYYFLRVLDAIQSSSGSGRD